MSFLPCVTRASACASSEKRPTSARVSASWNLSEFSDAREDIRYAVDVGYSRSIARDLTGNISYRFTKNTSDDAAQEFTENRIAATLTMLF